MRKAALAAAAFACLVVTAQAAAGVRIAGIDTSGFPEIRVTAVTGTGDGRPRITENGAPVVGLQAANLGNTKSIVLAVDRSQSMAGHKLVDATSAAKLFVDSKGASDRVQVIAFGQHAVALTRFSSSPADSDAALAGVQADPHQGTALWDAVVRASTELRYESAPGHVILLVTDGQDVSSTASLTTAVAAAHAARAAVYAIGIAGRGFTPAPLRELATATGGAFREATSSSQLSTLYASIRSSLTHTWQLSYVTAVRPGDALSIRVGVPGASTARTIDLGGGGAVPSAPQPSLLPRSAWTSPAASAALALGVGLLVLFAVAFGLSARNGSWLSARLAPHVAPTRRRSRRRRKGEGRTLVRPVLTATENALANVKQFRGLQQLITRADLPLLAAELLYACIGCGIVGAIIAGIAGASALVVVVVMAACGSIPVAWVSWKATKRMKAFDYQLPDLLITVSASLKAGHSFRHAIQAVVDEGAEPAAKEFRRVLTETKLGRPMDEALAEMSDRIGSKNLSFVLTAVTIQRQIGGSLAGLFDMVAETVRQRQQFARKIRSLTAMGRMSAYVLAGLPFCVALLISFISPVYMSPLWHTSTGHVLVGMGIGMLAFGSLILKKIVSFKG
ncbi:MAG TPA: type II secretion system F family protein [Gaiellaceae bacterium]|nr:type II secretion system F family protein [Gaiellaceae bacterium]